MSDQTSEQTSAATQASGGADYGEADGSTSDGATSSGVTDHGDGRHSSDYGVDVDQDELDKVLDDASTGNTTDAFDPDAATDAVGSDSHARPDAQDGSQDDTGTISQAF